MVLSRPKRNSSRENSGMQGETDEGANTSAMDLALASLQPLRDLARNWDVDVASCLEEYLQELAGIHPQQLQKLAEGSTTNNNVSNSTNSDENDVPNFAHAALILQNSSNVYSRKVEYLYSLVYKALEEFFQASKANSSNKNGRKNKTVDADIDEFFDFDPHECFLLLDDVVPEDITPSHRKINLKDDDEEEEESRDRTSSIGGDEVPGSAKSRNMTRLSLGGLSVTRMERNSTFSNGGISSQQQQRALLGILNNGGLRLMSGHCDVGDNGVLLMPGSQSIRSNLNSQNLDEEIMDNPNNSFHNGLQDTLGSERRNLFDGNENDFDDNDDGPGFVMNDDFIEDGDADMIGTGNDKNGVEGVATLALSQKPPTKSVAFADSVDEEMRKKQQRQKEKKDPWQLLDPHSVGDDLYRPRPLKRGKTYKLPEGILRPPSDCVTGSSTSRTTKPERRSLAPPSLRPSLAVESFRVSMGKQLEASNKVAYRGLAYGEEFMYIAKENAKVKAAKRRKERKRQQEVISSLQREDKQSIGDLNNEGLYDDEDDNGVGIDFGGGDDYYDEGDQDYSAGNSGLVNLDDAFGSGQPNDDDDIQDKGSNYGKSFEDLCRAHIEAFAKSAEKFALTTKLTERISQWQAHLAPILEEEERKASFDIHRYSEMLLESAIETAEDMKRESTGGHPSDDFYKTKNSVDFQSVAHGCTRSDICRLFLASLSLANSGNLKIEEGALDYRFEILSSKVDKPMETYRAPSATTV